MQLRLVKIQRIVTRLALAVTIVALSTALVTSKPVTSIDRVLSQGVLRMVTVEGPTTYYQSVRGKDGFEYFLAKAFADHLGVELKISVGQDLTSMLHTLTGPQANFAGAGVAVTDERKKWLHFSRPYDQVEQTVIYRLGTPKPESIEDLSSGRLVVVIGSSHHARLKSLRESHPSLSWEALDNTEMLGLMHLVHSGEADYAVIDSSAFSINRSIYPKARAAFQLSNPDPLAWAFPKHIDTSLVQAANDFLDEYQASGELDRLKKHFYSPTEAFTVGGSQVFNQRIQKRLPNYEELFRQTAEEYNLDWHLLAAIAYQESHWDPLATSPTGVRGLMMLTKITAREMGVPDRLDPMQSVRGGAEYFLKLKQRLPKYIVEPDRTWFALAAYNVGLGHLEDAQLLAYKHGANPNQWGEVQRYLPLLSQRKYFNNTRYGFARGKEPVNYVENIRHFRTILRWRSQEEKRMLQAVLETKYRNLRTPTLYSL